MKIVVVGTGYVGLSNAILLSQNHEVVCLDIDRNRIENLNKKKLPIYDEEMIQFLRDKPLNFRANQDNNDAYANAQYVIIDNPTDYDEETNNFNASSIESVAKDVIRINPNAVMVINSTIPVGYIKSLREKLNF